MASVYTITHMTWQLEGTKESNCSFITATLPPPKSLIYSWRQLWLGQGGLGQKGEATCPRPPSRSDVNLGIRI